MFCPNAADFGNIADWVAGIGAFLAVATALYIAGGERRATARIRNIARNEERERQARVATEAIRLAAEVEALAGNYMQLLTHGGGTSKGNRADLLDNMDGVRRQLESLQTFPMTDPRLFAEIGRTASDCRLEAGLVDSSTSYAQIIMERVAERMQTRRKALTGLTG